MCVCESVHVYLHKGQFEEENQRGSKVVIRMCFKPEASSLFSIFFFHLASSLTSLPVSRWLLRKVGDYTDQQVEISGTADNVQRSELIVKYSFLWRCYRGTAVSLLNVEALALRGTSLDSEAMVRCHRWSFLIGAESSKAFYILYMTVLATMEVSLQYCMEKVKSRIYDTKFLTASSHVSGRAQNEETD